VEAAVEDLQALAEPAAVDQQVLLEHLAQPILAVVAVVIHIMRALGLVAMEEKD
jgi:hypothetical protein